MGTSYSKSYSLSFMYGVRPARTNTEEICDRVHALNESMQMQLKEADRRYMELCECHERHKEQCSGCNRCSP